MLIQVRSLHRNSVDEIVLFSRGVGSVYVCRVRGGISRLEIPHGPAHVSGVTENGEAG